MTPVREVRAARAADLDALLELARARRQQYARFQPLFWRPAPDAVARQRPYLAALVEDEAAISLVAVTEDDVVGFAIATPVPVPPVYDPGGPTYLLDDFAVADSATWSTVGVDLLGAVRAAARQRGGSQVVVVTAHLDEPKRAALAASGLSMASEWWVASLGDD